MQRGGEKNAKNGSNEKLRPNREVVEFMCTYVG
jgi:hypothetical protein